MFWLKKKDQDQETPSYVFKLSAIETVALYNVVNDVRVLSLRNYLFLNLTKGFYNLTLTNQLEQRKNVAALF